MIRSAGQEQPATSMATSSSRRKYDGRFSSLLKRLRTDADPGLRIAAFRKRADRGELLPLAHTLNDLPAYREYALGAPIPTSLADLKPLRDIYPLEAEDELIWSACELRVYAKHIAAFITHEQAIAASLLAADYARAASLLHEASPMFGYSLWYLEHHIALLEQTQGFAAQKSFALGILDADNLDPVIACCIHYYSFRAEKAVSPDRYQAELKRSLPLIFESTDGLGQYLAFRLCFFGEIRFHNIAGIIQNDRGTSIVDRYLTFTRVAQLIVSDPALRCYSNALRRSLDILGEKFDSDTRITNVKHVLGHRSLGTVPADSKRFVQISDLYTVGKYAECLALFSTADNAKELDTYELAAKASARTRQDLLPELSATRQQLIHRMRDILLKTEASAEAYQDLLKQAFTHQSTSWSAQLFTFLMREFRHGSYNLPVRYATVGDLNGPAFNPRLAAVFHKIEDGTSYLRHISNQLGCTSTTCELFNAVIRNDPASLGQLQTLGLPTSRFRKYRANLDALLGHYNSAIDGFRLLSQSTDLLDVQDGIVGLVRCYVGAERLDDAVNTLADVAIAHHNLRVRLPIGDVLDRIEVPANRYLFRNMAVPVLYDIFNRISGYERRITRSISYEEFLSMRSVRRPSELSLLRDSYSLPQLTYFLRYVCVPSIMDSSVEFMSSEDVELERISICQVLTDIDPANAEHYLDEVKEITQRLVVSRGLRLVEQSKIYVDVEGVRRAVDSELRDGFNRYKEFLSSPALNQTTERLIVMLERTLKEGGSDVTLVLPSNNRHETFRHFFLILRDAFVSNNEHGLDGYLSVGIRHGTLSGQIRSAFERSKLITQRDEAGRYKPNDYWRELLYSHEWPRPNVDHALLSLARLSQDADQIIDHIRNIDLQIRTESKNAEGLFDFRARMEDLLPLQRAIGTDTTYERAVDLVIAKLWEMTDAALTNVRVKITTYKQDFGRLLDRLQQEIRTIAADSSTVGLDDAIAECRTTLQDELDKIAAWFKRTAQNSVHDFDISLPVDIAMRVVNSINPNNQIAPLKRFSGEQKLKGKTLKSFVDIVFILLDNALKHSRVAARAPDLIIEGECSSTALRLFVSNEMAPPSDRLAYEARLVQIKQQLGQEPSQALVSKEGGTGLHKIFKILRVDLDCEFQMDFYLTAERFVFEATIERAWFLS